MKKHSLALLLAVSMILLLCAACGGNSSETVQVSATMAPTDTPAPTPTATPEPTDTPEPTATPEVEGTEAPAEQESESQSDNNSHSDNSQSNSGNTQSQPTPTPEPASQADPIDIARGMSGGDVSALIAAIGSPNSSTYSSSCLVIGAEDGELYYDGFSVGTIRYPDGSELIIGVYG